MERKGERQGRTKGLLAYGSTGMLAAVTLLMVLSPASAAAVHPSTTLTAPYKGTLASPNTYTSTSGCAAAKVTSPPKWSGTTGVFGAASSSKAVTCAKSLGYVGSSSYGDVGTGASIAIPLRVASNGNHGVALAWSIALAEAVANTVGGCPTSKVTYPPAPSSSESSYCESGTDVSVYIDTYITDLNNASWRSNYSYVDTYNETYWENSTYCYNFGTPACSNSTGSHTYAFSYGYNEKGTFAFPGTSTLTMWNNGTNMVRSHHYVLTIYFSMYNDAFVDQYNLVSHWPASATGSVNMATLGNGAKLSSITVV